MRKQEIVVWDPKDHLEKLENLLRDLLKEGYHIDNVIPTYVNDYGSTKQAIIIISKE